MTGPRVLFLPLSNVLGHLARTFALAEKLLEYNAEVHIAACDHYNTLFHVLPEEIVIHPSIEMPPDSSRSFGKIVSFEEGEEHDIRNLNSANNLSSEEMQIRVDFLRKMVEQDEALIQKLKPDVIITDYRYTILNMNITDDVRVFHISNFLGFPSFYNRVRGQLFLPLNQDTVLVPGIASLEEVEQEFSSQNANVHWCGHFNWKGWKRLKKENSNQSKIDVFLSFGSTGNAQNLVPWLIENIDLNYSLLTAMDTEHAQGDRENVHNEQFGSLEQSLMRSRVVCCHGGHGTVMESILHERPMIIFPNNLEQLEIGRRIEKLGLGVLINKPQEEITTDQLNKTIEDVLCNAYMKEKLAHYARCIKASGGTENAVKIILKK